MKKLLLLILAFVIVLVYSQSAWSQTVRLVTPSGYSTEALVYKSFIKQQMISCVVVHGKSGRPDAPFLKELCSNLSGAGYSVLAPKMPWSSWDGTFEQGVEVIASAVENAGEGGKRVIVIGHSLGAAGTLTYASRHLSSSNLAGVVVLSAGHILSRNPGLIEVTSSSVESAKRN